MLKSDFAHRQQYSKQVNFSCFCMLLCSYQCQSRLTLVFWWNLLSPPFISHMLTIILKLRGRQLLFKITFGGVIIVLANKSIMISSFTLLSVSVMISSLNDYFELCRKPISLKIYYTCHEMTDFTIHQKSQFSGQSSQS